MEDERRMILNQVAEGKLTPQDAATRLEDLDRIELPAPEPVRVRELPQPGGPVATGEIRKLRVKSTAGSITITGDPAVREAVAEGDHVAHRDGDTITIEAELPEEVRAGGFIFSRSGLGISLRGVRALRIRANPDLQLDLDSQAGSVRILGMRGPIHSVTQAGSTTVEGFEGPLDISTQAGSVRCSGRITKGESRIRCEAGSVRLALSPDSNVTVKASSVLGRIQLDDGPPTAGILIGGATKTAVFGSGAANIDISATMGSVRVERLP